MGSDSKDSKDEFPLDEPPAYEEIAGSSLPIAVPKLNLSSHAGAIDTTTITPDQCAAHLKFLAALADLQESIANNDGLFGLHDSDVDKFRDFANEARARIREKRWAVYVAKAVERYTAWWDACVPDHGTRPTIASLKEAKYRGITVCSSKICWSRFHMPPLDVLMVWHSHMLNPRSFLEDSIRYAKMSVWTSGFPFDIVDGCINDYNLEYNPGESAKLFFESKTGLPWDNLDDSPEKLVECPSCEQPVSVPWTDGQISQAADKIFEAFYGFADKNFQTVCTACGTKIDHERLKVAKFRKDFAALLEKRLPMPGSFFCLRGVPEAAIVHTAHPSTFPNRFLWASHRSLLGLSDTELKQYRSVSDLRDGLEMRLKDRDILRDASGGAIRFDLSSDENWRLEMKGVRTRSDLGPEEKITFRRMMSRYWDNFTPFALDLTGAVIRQGVFVRKMDKIDWLHSPAVMATMNRLIEKYHVFLRIMVTSPFTMAVPTLDVDLAWHTHQLTPSRYYFYCLRATRDSDQTERPYFIDHDDKVDEAKLSDGFERTSRMYRKLTDGEVYSECYCWYCEATRVPDIYGALITTPSISKARSAADSLHNSASADPDNNPHVSAHNAVNPEREYVPGPSPRQVKSMLLRNNYEKALRRLQKRNKKQGKQAEKQSPDDDSQAFRSVWGYPVAIPFYGPYIVDPNIHSEVYPCKPACMTFVPGAPGNCVAGTCGGGVAAGACGGTGAGKCSGGCSAGHGFGRCGGFAGGCGGGGCGGGCGGN